METGRALETLGPADHRKLFFVINRLQYPVMNTAQIITENGHQAVWLPDQFHLEGSEVLVKRIGRSLLLIPRGTNPWEMLTASLDEFTEDYMQDRAQPAEQFREPLSE
jgi:antitoxin VapB